MSGKEVKIIGKRWHVLETLAKANGWKRYVELGVYKGLTFLHLLQRVPNLTMIGVDLYRQPEGDGAEVYEEDMDALYRAAIETLQPFGDRARLLRMSTIDASQYIPDASCDCVFVDADHRKCPVIADVTAWRPKVRPGGWLMGHDYNWPGVRGGLGTVGITDPILFFDNVWGIRIE